MPNVSRSPCCDAPLFGSEKIIEQQLLSSIETLCLQNQEKVTVIRITGMCVFAQRNCFLMKAVLSLITLLPKTPPPVKIHRQRGPIETEHYRELQLKVIHGKLNHFHTLPPVRNLNVLVFHGLYPNARWVYASMPIVPAPSHIYRQRGIYKTHHQTESQERVICGKLNHCHTYTATSLKSAL